MKCPDLGRPIVLNAPPVRGGESGVEGEGGGMEDAGPCGGMSVSEGRKITFIDRLLGRQGKRRSVVLS